MARINNRYTNNINNSDYRHIIHIKIKSLLVISVSLRFIHLRTS